MDDRSSVGYTGRGSAASEGSIWNSDTVFEHEEDRESFSITQIMADLEAYFRILSLLKEGDLSHVADSYVETCHGLLKRSHLLLFIENQKFKALNNPCAYFATTIHHYCPS